MRENPQQTFGLLRRPASRAQSRTETAFMARDRTLDLPALAVDSAKEAPFHLASVFCRGPRSGSSLARRNDGGTNAELLSGKYMIVFGIVASIGQEPIEVDVRGGLTHGRRELRRVLRGTQAHKGTRQEVALAVTHQRQLRPVQAGKALLAATPDVVAADMTGLEPRGVDDALGTLADQCALVRALKDDSLEKNEGVFFNSRRSAYERVE